ncbi:MAG TPA: hypothetical protein VF433_13945, partial [Cellvibrio sp.]
MTDNNNLSVSRRRLLTGSATLATAAWLSPAFAADPGLRSTIYTQHTRPPILPKIYGGFIEHIGNLINHSLWSETLDDRKFYFGVLEKPEPEPTDRRARMAMMQKWLAVGPISAISLDTQNAYVGEHSPVVALDAAQERGMVQHKLAIKSGV